MNILFDTNILLDVFLQRKPHFKNSAFLTDLAEKGILTGWLCATTVTTLYYLLHKELNKEVAETVIKSLFKVFDVSAVNRMVLETAIESNFRDYEDAVLHQAAFHSNLEGIVTRNKKDFKKSSLSVYTPDELISILEQS
jgi:predicted nucleic acid-binding protein